MNSFMCGVMRWGGLGVGWLFRGGDLKSNNLNRIRYNKVKRIKRSKKTEIHNYWRGNLVAN